MRRHLGTTTTDQEIEVASFVGLQNVVYIKIAISTRIGRRTPVDFRPCGQPRRHFRFVDFDMQPPRLAIELDPIAIAHDGQRPARAASGATCNTTVP